MKKPTKQNTKSSSKELSQADLEKISGGVGHGTSTASSSSSSVAGKKKSSHSNTPNTGTVGSGKTIQQSH